MGTESNNGKQEDQVLNGEQLMRLVENRLLTDRMLLSMFGDRRRNIESECGYKQTAEITAKDYQDIFDREPVAARVVNVFPMECWQLSPQLIEDEDIDNVTEFEQTWTDIGRSILSPGMEGYFKDERVNPLWSYLERADIWSGIGSYGTILLGIDDGKELEEPAQFISKSGSATRKLNFLRVLSEVECQITQFDNDRTSVRYGKPEMYNVVFGTPSFNQTKPYIGSAIGANQMATRKVHWSRIIHVVDNPYGTEVGGIPRMQQVYNRLYDLHKLYGGSAEMYWQGAFPGISFETHPSLGGDVKLDEPTRRAMKEQLVNYTQGLQRWLTMAGMSAKTLAPQVVDPTSHIEAEIQAICILLGVPKRVFMGSERGELSSNQDIRAWYGRCKHRQDTYITPFLIVQFIDRLINLGVLPVPKQGYSIQWPDLASATDLEKAQIAVQRMQALSSYMMGQLYQLVTPKDALTRIVGFDESEANQMIEDTQENMDQMQEAHLEQSTQPPEPPQGDQQGGDKKEVNNSEPSVVVENNWDVEWVEDSLVNNTIVKTTAGYMVVSESKGANGKRKNLGGPYASRQKAEKRLQQVEYFKHQDVDNTWSDAARLAALQARRRRKGLIDSPEFKKWFGDSKVVDEYGDPLVVYRGGSAMDWNWDEENENPRYVNVLQRSGEFPAFHHGEKGVNIAAFFTDDPNVADRFASLGDGRYPRHASIFPVYLSFQNPWIVDAEGKPAGEFQFGASGKPFREAIRSGNYDSVIIKNTGDEGTLYVALKPTQIKSATGNRGTFDTNNPDIRNSKGNFGHKGRPGQRGGSSKHEEAAEHEYQQTLGGEYWLQDGIALYADGDVGDMNHEGYAIAQAQRLLADGLGVDTDGEYIDWDEVISALKEQVIEEFPGKWDEEKIEDDAIDPIADLDDKELNQLGVDKELWHIAQGHGDTRAYAADNWDWIRLAGNSVQMKSESQLKQLGDGIADAHQDVDLDNESFDIETKRAFYRDVPWSVIDGGKPADLQEYKAHGTPGWGGVQNMDVDNAWSDEARQKALETRRRNKEIKAIKDKPLGKGAMKIAEQTPIATSIKQPGQIKYGPGDELRRMAKMTYEQARQHTEIRSNTAHKQTKDINPSASIAEQMSQTNAAAFDHHIAAQSHKVASGLTHDAELVRYHQLRVGQHNKQHEQLQAKFMELRAKQLEESAPVTKAEPAPQHQEDMEAYQAHRKADHALTQARKAVKDANVGVNAPNKMVRDRYLNKGISELKQHIATLRQGSEAHQREADRLEKKVADYQKLVNNAWSDKAREAAALSRKAHAAGTKASKLPTANSMVRSMRRFTGKENKPITTQIANRGIKLHKQAVEAHQAAVKALVGVDPDSLSKRENDELVDTIQTHEYSIDHHRGEVKHYKKWLSQFGDTQS